MPFICDNCGCYLNIQFDKKNSCEKHYTINSSISILNYRSPTCSVSIECKKCGYGQSLPITDPGIIEIQKLWNRSIRVKSVKDFIWKSEERLRLRNFLNSEPSKSDILLHTAREKNEYLREVLKRILKRGL